MVSFAVGQPLMQTGRKGSHPATRGATNLEGGKTAGNSGAKTSIVLEGLKPVPLRSSPSRFFVKRVTKLLSYLIHFKSEFSVTTR